LTGFKYLNVEMQLMNWSKLTRKELGNAGEKITERYLIKHGLKILRRNAVNRLGEVDILAARDKTLYTVEVKTRRDTDRGTPEDLLKRNIPQLRKLAIYWSQMYSYERARVIGVCIKLRTTTTEKNTPGLSIKVYEI
jgi:Holliday junction resolvase-like predicted endonuclease